MKKTSKLAIASLICGVYGVVGGFGLLLLIEARSLDRDGLCFLLLVISFAVSSVLALLLGVTALVQILRRWKTTKGLPMAVAGLLLVGTPALFAVLSPTPGLLRSRANANESSAVGSLRALATRQAAFAENCEVDQEGDRTGEYGYLCELCGEIAPRGRGDTNRLAAQYIPRSFATGGTSGKGYAEKSGYRFRVYLATLDGEPMDDRACWKEEQRTDIEPQDNGNEARLSIRPEERRSMVPTWPGSHRSTGWRCFMVNEIGSTSYVQQVQRAIDMQEKHFVIYAWPADAGETGRRCFVVNEMGEPYATRMEKTLYSGTNGPSADAAFSAKGSGWPNGDLAAGRDDPGKDGNTWNPCGQ